MAAEVTQGQCQTWVPVPGDSTRGTKHSRIRHRVVLVCPVSLWARHVVGLGVLFCPLCLHLGWRWKESAALPQLSSGIAVWHQEKGASSGSDACSLQDLGQVTSPLWASGDLR